MTNEIKTKAHMTQSKSNTISIRKRNPLDISSKHQTIRIIKKRKITSKLCPHFLDKNSAVFQFFVVDKNIHWKSFSSRRF